MLGRVLFAFVWLIIAAGLVLPLYPRDVVTSVVTAADDQVQPVAGSDLFGCEDCVVADDGALDCLPDCFCGHVLPTATRSVENAFNLTLFIVVHPEPPGLPSGPQPLPPKLPAI